MTSEGSVTHWIDGFKAGDSTAAQPLLDRYLQRLVAVARDKLRGAPRIIANEEDVALSALNSVLEGIGCGQFSRLQDRDDLLKLLIVVTLRKAASLIRYQKRQSRDCDRTRSIWNLEESELEQILSEEPTPESVVLMAEGLQQLLDHLGDETLRKVAVWKMENYTNAEIAKELGCVVQTVERKVKSIKQIWIKVLGHERSILDR